MKTGYERETIGQISAQEIFVCASFGKDCCLILKRYSSNTRNKNHGLNYYLPREGLGNSNPVCCSTDQPDKFL